MKEPLQEKLKGMVILRGLSQPDMGELELLKPQLRDFSFEKKSLRVTQE